MRKEITVKDYMASNLVTFPPDMSILDAINELVCNKISGACVVDKQGNLAGILSERDCMKAALNAACHGEMEGKVEEFMTRDVKTVQADMSIIELARLFHTERLRRYVVFDEKNRLVGQISRRDVLRALQALWP